jgi:hypothetical protein
MKELKIHLENHPAAPSLNKITGSEINPMCGNAAVYETNG